MGELWRVGISEAFFVSSGYSHRVRPLAFCVEDVLYTDGDSVERPAFRQGNAIQSSRLLENEIWI